MHDDDGDGLTGNPKTGKGKAILAVLSVYLYLGL
jgi:hypothetical protein